MVPDAVAAHYTGQQQLAARTLVEARRQWQRMDPAAFDASWSLISGRLQILLTSAQLAAAVAGARYVPVTLTELGIAAPPVATPRPQALAGVASDGRPLDTLLYEPVIAAKVAVSAGTSPAEALSRAGSALDRIVLTQVADAGRESASVAIAARPAVTGWVRMLNPPSCSRCALLAGKFYRWSSGFARHPRCDCVHIPAVESVAGDLRTDPLAAIEAGQVRGLSRADTRAILDDHADVGQVINAHRGMYTADAYGQRVKATQEGVTKRGVAGQQMLAQGGSYTRAPRLRPEAIYRLAGGDRQQAITLLGRFGYLTS